MVKGKRVKISFGVRMADIVSQFVGSWTFIVIQSGFLVLWIVLNALHFVHYDPYPFVFLNLVLAFQAGYSTPFILMSANRQSMKDRKRSLDDLKLDKDSNDDIKVILKELEEIKKIIKDFQK